MGKCHNLAAKLRKALFGQSVLALAQGFKLLAEPPGFVHHIDQVVFRNPFSLPGTIVYIARRGGAYDGLVPEHHAPVQIISGKRALLHLVTDNMAGLKINNHTNHHI